MLRNALIFGTTEFMNFCPPNPGFTLITKTKSALLSMPLIFAKADPGFKDTPNFMPFFFICAAYLLNAAGRIVSA